MFECADWLIRVHFSVTPGALVKIMIGNFENARLTIGPFQQRKSAIVFEELANKDSVAEANHLGFYHRRISLALFLLQVVLGRSRCPTIRE